MSKPKITSKNLEYDSTLPPFLQRLKGEFGGPGDGRHERQIARPKRARDPNADEDDAPTYVDEETNHTLSKEEYEALVKGPDAPTEPAEETKDDKNLETEDNKRVEKEKVAGIGAAKKRKVGKVVGGDEDDEDKKAGEEQIKAGPEQSVGAEAKPSGTSKQKKKSKKIKLSFNDDEAS